MIERATSFRPPSASWCLTGSEWTSTAAARTAIAIVSQITSPGANSPSSAKNPKATSTPTLAMMIPVSVLLNIGHLQ